MRPSRLLCDFLLQSCNTFFAVKEKSKKEKEMKIEIKCKQKKKKREKTVHINISRRTKIHRFQLSNQSLCNNVYEIQANDKFAALKRSTRVRLDANVCIQERFETV